MKYNRSKGVSKIYLFHIKIMLYLRHVPGISWADPQVNIFPWLSKNIYIYIYIIKSNFNPNRQKYYSREIIGQQK